MNVRPKGHRVALDSLLEKAEVQGYLTTDDLMEAHPDAASDTERLGILLTSLRKHGVELVDPDEDDSSDSGFESDSPEAGPASFTSRSTDGALANDDMVSLYLKEMARVPLLSMDEEFNLAIRIAAGRKARKKLETNARPSISLRRQMESIINDGQAAREHLIKANTRLVVSIAKRYLGNGVHLLDLIQEGNLGLMKAVEKFDHKRGFRFSTYATWWIRQTISRAISDQSRTIRVPIHMNDRIRQLYKAQHDLEQNLGRQPTVEELAQSVDIPVRKVQWILRVSWQPLSLESPIGDDEDSELGQFIEDKISPTPMHSAYLSMLKDKLSNVLDNLTPREARVLRLRFGLDDGNSYTLEEVGQKFGLTRERIRQIEGQALRHLRHPRNTKQLKDYL